MTTSMLLPTWFSYKLGHLFRRFIDNPPKQLKKHVSQLPSENVEVRVLADRILDQIPHTSVTVKDVITLRILRANQTACAWFGSCESKLLGKTVFELLSDLATAKLEDAADREAIIKGTHDIETWVLVNGVRRRIRSNRFLYVDAFSNRKLLVTLSNDVTDVHTAFVEASDLERTTHSLLSGLPIPIVWLDRDHRIKGNNLAFSIFTETDLPVNQTLIDLFPFKVAESIRNLCKEVEDTNLPVSRQITVWRKQEMVEMVVHATPLHNVYSQVIGTVVTLYDISGVVQSASLSGQLAMAFDMSTDSIILTDENMVINYVNPAMCRNTDFKRTELVGKSLSLLQVSMPPNDHRLMLDALNSGLPWHSQVTSRTQAGTKLNHAATILPILNGKGKAVAFLSIWHTEGLHNEDFKPSTTLSNITSTH